MKASLLRLALMVALGAVAVLVVAAWLASLASAEQIWGGRAEALKITVTSGSVRVSPAYWQRAGFPGKERAYLVGPWWWLTATVRNDSAATFRDRFPHLEFVFSRLPEGDPHGSPSFLCAGGSDSPQIAKPWRPGEERSLMIICQAPILHLTTPETEVARQAAREALAQYLPARDQLKVTVKYARNAEGASQ